jgi:virulence factor Mce-like protein
VKVRHLVSFLVFAVIISGAVYYIGALGVRIGPPKHRVNVSMQVPDINGIVVDSNVLLRGVQVGKVTGIDTALAGATIHFYIDGAHPVPVDSDVRLENLSALGESYIGLVPRRSDGPTFHDGQYVATEDITQPASISELATSVVRVLNQLDPDAINRLVREADEALPDQQVVLPNLHRASVLLRNAVTSMDGRGSEVLKNMEILLQNADWLGPRIAEINPALLALGTPVEQMFLAATSVVMDTGAPQSLQNTGKLFGRIQQFLDTRAPDLQIFAEAFTPNIKGIASAALTFDTGQILSNMLDALPEDGTITLRVKTPNP